MRDLARFSWSSRGRTSAGSARVRSVPAAWWRRIR